MLATRLWQILPLVFLGAALLLSLVSSVHAILHKRDPRAAVSWTGLIWLVPIGGALLYGAFGVNRIARRAGKLRRRRKSVELTKPSTICTDAELRAALTPTHEHLASIAQVGNKLSGRTLL